VPEGTPVKAAEDGVVTYAGSEVKGYGKLVLIRHDNGYVSAYAHNGDIAVKAGEKVRRGQVVAKSGQSGNVTSPQLHFEIRKGATPVDPMVHLASN
jgi:murein DD-endopeptidase MepM/ murein hydrolase activator NlpD